jgi:phosphoglycolate phosphatase
MEGIRLALFDLDGTITDPFEGIFHSVNHALRALERPELTPEIGRRFIGPALMDSFQRWCGLDEKTAQRAIDIYREYYGPKGMYECYVYPGIPELMTRLREAGLRLAVTTSKAEPYARRLLEHYGIDRRLDGIIGAALYSTTNEKVELVRRTLRELGETDPARAVMVGDREFDVKGGRAAGVHTVGVSYGYGSLEELTRAGAEAIADSPAAVGDAILGAR